MKCPKKVRQKFNAKIVQAAERVCWQLARCECCKLAVEFYSRMGYAMFEMS